jgi:cation diffusion facilitator family transporter
MVESDQAAKPTEDEGVSGAGPELAPWPPRPHGYRTAAQRFNAAVRGPLLGLVINIILVVVKAIAGVASGSAALLADAGHSGADLANNVLVLGSLIYSRRPADEDHPYGHDRAEVLAAAASAGVLVAVALVFGWDSLQKIINGEAVPGILALWVAIGTLVVKLIMAWIEMVIARDVTSLAVAADARDNLADALSSLAVIVGVIGARIGNPRIDGIAGLVIAVLILVTAVRIGAEASHELLEHNLEPGTLDRVRAAATGVEGVLAVSAVTGRAHGSDVLVEISLQVDPQASVAQGAATADAVRAAVQASVPEVGDVLIELNTNHVQRLRRHFR